MWSDLNLQKYGSVLEGVTSGEALRSRTSAAKFATLGSTLEDGEAELLEADADAAPTAAGLGVEEDADGG